MQNKYIEKLKKAALAVFVNEDVKIILFGSRARNDGSVTSDVDVGLRDKGDGSILVDSRLRGNDSGR